MNSAQEEMPREQHRQLNNPAPRSLAGNQRSNNREDTHSHRDRDISSLVSHSSQLSSMDSRRKVNPPTAMVSLRKGTQRNSSTVSPRTASKVTKHLDRAIQPQIRRLA